MSDSVASANMEAQADSALGVTASAGTLLRQGRQAAGLHIAALAVSLKVPVHRLEALEADRFDLLTDAVFARGLASSVCRVLKMDAAPVLSRLPVPPVPRLNPATMRNPDSYTTGDSARGLAALRSLSKPVLGSAAALVLAAAALVAWPMLQSFLGSTAGGEVAALPSETGLQPASGSDSHLAVSGQVQPAEVVTNVVPMSLPSLPAATATPAASLVSAAPSAQVAPNAQNTPAPPPTTAAPSPTSGIVVFSPSAASWVEVTDAKGMVVLRRMLAAGEVVGASGALPLNAVVGRADVTKVQVRGQAFDLSSIARENVARFEVK